MRYGGAGVLKEKRGTATQLERASAAWTNWRFASQPKQQKNADRKQGGKTEK